MLVHKVPLVFWLILLEFVVIVVREVESVSLERQLQRFLRR